MYLHLKMARQRKPIGERVLKNYNFLKKLGKTSSAKLRKKIIQNATCDELLSLTEISANILSGNFDLTRRQRNKLQPFANFIRKLARARSECGARKIILNQQGGQAAVIGALLAPILVEAAQHLISKVAENV